ncbi:methyltransferase domain-containing protein [Sphingomonas sp.]|uniref:class I SAM-dependent methyltransferase n=1 Tax=Sphingomonas sp. TaxID=28214 RepID=UPI0025EE995C|nr:methyltransferase domain-containing protein [Sphingomonas sp.]MBV9527569.1 class I SAM-dependent methyltransferase [Sphingomonas sp.]
MTKPGDTAPEVSERRRAPQAHDAFASFPERIAQLQAVLPMEERTRANLERSLTGIDAQERERFLATHGERLQDLATFGPAKYADFTYWAHRSALVAEWLDLDRSPPLDILDIGMGSGSFAMVVQSMGHRVTGTDVADEWYDELCRLAGVRRVVAPVERGADYRPVEDRFDLITIMLPVFHRRRVDGRREYWAVEDWRRFLAGLQRDLLKPGGAIFILMPLDKNDEGEESYSPVLAWAEARGATLGRTHPSQPIAHILWRPVEAETFAPDNRD